MKKKIGIIIPIFRSLGCFSSIVASLMACFVCLSVLSVLAMCEYTCPLRPVESSGITRSRVAQDQNTPKHPFSKFCDIEHFRTLFRFSTAHTPTSLYYNVQFFLSLAPRFATVILVIFSVRKEACVAVLHRASNWTILD